MAQQPQKNETANESNPRSDAGSRKEEPRTWAQRNGGNIIGIITFGAIALVTFLMWLSNNQ